MTKLSDMQLVLLSSAAARDDGSLLPLSESLGARSPAIEKAIKALVKRDLAQEGPVRDVARTWIETGDQRIGVVITDSGRAALGIDVDDPAPPESEESVAAPAVPQTKAAQVIALLRRDEGATLAEMVEATNWLPHTTRAALTGFRKKGHNLAKSKRGEVTCYRIVEAG